MKDHKLIYHRGKSVFASKYICPYILLQNIYCLFFLAICSFKGKVYHHYPSEHEDNYMLGNKLTAQ